MRKTLQYSGFIFAGLFVVMAFITARSYTQLVVGIILYPILIYFAFKLFPRRNTPSKQEEQPAAQVNNQTIVETNNPKTIQDEDKRDFIKLIGAAGVSFLVVSFLGRWADGLFSNKSLLSGVKSNGESIKDEIAGSRNLTDGYKIAEIDDASETAYYGFTDANGGWLIMKAGTDGSSFRYIRGEKDFPLNWPKRENLTYGYYSEVF